MTDISKLTTEMSRTFYDLQHENRELRAIIEKMAEKETRKPMGLRVLPKFHTALYLRRSGQIRTYTPWTLHTRPDVK